MAKLYIVSPSIVKVLKYEEEELIQSNFIQLFHPADKELIRKTLTNSFSNPGIQQLESRSRIKHKSGKWMWVDGSISNLLENNDIRGIVYTSRDVTDLVESSEKLKAEQENKEALINATDDLIWSIDRNYELVAANAAFITRLKQATGIDLRPGDRLMREDKIKKESLVFWQSLYSRAFTGESFRQEIYTPPTEFIQTGSWAEINFNPIWHEKQVKCIACLSRNISERKGQEEKDKASALNQSLFSAIINASEDAMMSKDLDGIITSWNKGAEKIFGYTAGEIIGKPVTTIIPPELLEEESFILAQIKAKKSVEYYETVRIDKNGKRIIVSLVYRLYLILKEMWSGHQRFPEIFPNKKGLPTHCGKTRQGSRELLLPKPITLSGQISKENIPTPMISFLKTSDGLLTSKP